MTSSDFMNFMKLVEMEGLTGQIKFDQHGLRTGFLLEVVSSSSAAVLLFLCLCLSLFDSN